MVQWLRLHASNAGAWVQSLVRELDPTCMGERNGKKERYYQMPKKEQGAEICKLGVKGERPYIYIHICLYVCACVCIYIFIYLLIHRWFLLSIRALH